MNLYAIVLIETIPEYGRLKGNQGTMITNGSFWSQWIWNRVWKIMIEC